MSWVLAHPSVAPFVQQAALALDEAGELDRFITTLWSTPEGRWRRLAEGFRRSTGFDLARTLRRRELSELSSAQVTSFPAGEILRLLASRLDRTGRWGDMVWERSEHRFARRVAAELRPRHRGVYVYEHCGLEALQQARALTLRAVYDVPAPDSVFVQEILDREMKEFGALRGAYERHVAEREPRRLRRRREEWEQADRVIVASTYCRDSYARAGLDVSKVRVVPYGAPPPLAEDEVGRAESTARSSDRLRIVWAGTFGLRKGAHHALRAWRKGRLERIADLTVYGTVTLPQAAVAPLPAGVRLAGARPRDEVMSAFRSADLLLFPTLSDAFGMVITEAWSQGLPVASTRAAGAAERLAPGKNGLWLEAGSVDSIVAAVEWCHAHREALAHMRSQARATAAAWQWANYRAALRSAILGS